MGIVFLLELLSMPTLEVLYVREQDGERQAFARVNSGARWRER